MTRAGGADFRGSSFGEAQCDSAVLSAELSTAIYLPQAHRTDLRVKPLLVVSCFIASV